MQGNNAEHQMDTREAGKETSDPTNDVVEDRQQPKMFQILIHEWLSSRLGV